MQHTGLTSHQTGQPPPCRTCLPSWLCSAMAEELCSEDMSSFPFCPASYLLSSHTVPRAEMETTAQHRSHCHLLTDNHIPCLGLLSRQTCLDLYLAALGLRYKAKCKIVLGAAAAPLLIDHAGDERAGGSPAAGQEQGSRRRGSVLLMVPQGNSCSTYSP